jgi:ABC-type antimicrobial peptide transport system permease subunit
MFLALVGLYGVQSYLVSRRTREIGIRVALGEDSGRVLWSVLKRGLVTGGTGVVLGLLAALALTGLMQGFLFGVSATDPLIFTAVPLLLLMACVAATLMPALRAARVDPVSSLHQE